MCIPSIKSILLRNMVDAKLEIQNLEYLWFIF